MFSANTQMVISFFTQVFATIKSIIHRLRGCYSALIMVFWFKPYYFIISHVIFSSSFMIISNKRIII